LKHDTAIDILVEGCLRNDRRSQGQLYARFRGFAMGICLRYATDRDNAMENMNRGFQNVFLNLKKCRTERQFKAWIGRIMINISIDDLRRRGHRNLQNRQNRIAGIEQNQVDGIEQAELPGHSDTLPGLDYKDILALVQRLPQVLRKVFVLWAIEGYTHKEISIILGKSEGTCKYHLFAARGLLRKMILRKPCRL
jgi:RNA polymerase sigma factor (sigma-70 family)